MYEERFCVILITEDVWGAEFESLGQHFPIRFEPDLWKSPEKIHEALKDAQAIVVRNRTRVDGSMMDAGKHLRVISRAGVGLDNIDIEAANARGIAVSAALGINAVSVAEHVVGLALTLLRHTVQLDAELRRGEWNRIPGNELRGKTWGFLGFGATARATAKILRGFDLDFYAFDPYVNPDSVQASELNVRMANFDDVIANADIISIHLPNNPKTRDLVNAQTIARMKPGAYLINVGRGEVINESDLAAGLRSGILAGAALDVRSQEPPVVGELEKFSNVILTPHIAGVTKESQQAISKVLTEDIELALTGQQLRAAVGAIKMLSA